MKRKFKSIEDIEFELNIAKGDCDKCYYDGICSSLKDPFDMDNLGTDFQDFCFEYIREENDCLYPEKGTLEKNIPLIFPDIILDKIKDKQKIENTILNFCKSFCIVDCTDTCPFKEYKNEEKVQ